MVPQMGPRYRQARRTSYLKLTCMRKIWQSCESGQTSLSGIKNETVDWLAAVWCFGSFPRQTRCRSQWFESRRCFVADTQDHSIFWAGELGFVRRALPFRQQRSPYGSDRPARESGQGYGRAFAALPRTTAVPVITGAGSSPIHHLTGHGAPKPRETRTRWCGNTPTGGLVPVRWGSCKGMTVLRLGSSDLVRRLCPRSHFPTAWRQPGNSPRCRSSYGRSAQARSSTHNIRAFRRIPGLSSCDIYRPTVKPGRSE
jgi:hypothetical protein